MTLSSLIRKRDTVGIATAIPAISATQPKGEAATVARIATVAVANPKEEKTAPPAKVGAGETATASRWWLIHYPDRDPVEVACCPEATHADILERHPDAVAAEVERAMVAGFLAIFPSGSTRDLVEAHSGPNWAAAKG